MSFENVDPTPSAAPSDNGAPSPSPAIADPSATPGATPQAPVTAPPPQSQPEPSWLRGRLQETRDAAIRQANAVIAGTAGKKRTVPLSSLA